MCNIAMKDIQCFHHLYPLTLVDNVDKLWIIRHQKAAFNIPKAEYILVSKIRMLRFVQMLFYSIKLGCRKKVKWFVSINPFPYGLISYIAAKITRKKIHFGFMGGDWNRDINSCYGRFLLLFVKKVDAITVTGKKMMEGLIQKGIVSKKICILPHSIDVTKFTINNPEKTIYDCIYIGEFIQLKQIHVICKAFAIVVKNKPAAKLCLVGKGPELKSIKNLINELNLQDNIVFTGFTTEVFKYLQQSKIIVMASLHEGFPFALVEAGCSGVVSITTPAGTIKDHIRHNYNGMIFPFKDYKVCANNILDVLNSKEKYNLLRNNILKFRNEFHYNKAINTWENCLNLKQQKC